MDQVVIFLYFNSVAYKGGKFMYLLCNINLEVVIIALLRLYLLLACYFRFL